MISVIIPVRQGGSPETTLRSLAGEIGGAEVIISWDEEPGNANRARNAGAKLARGGYLLFSDDDIEWQPGAVAALRAALEERPEFSWAYGCYEMAGRNYCQRAFNVEDLRRVNYVSTMSLIRRADFPGFDESILRLQDWDLWLSMMAAGAIGCYCRRLVFRTQRREGITFGNSLSWERAAEIVRRKHGLRT